MLHSRISRARTTTLSRRTTAGWFAERESSGSLGQVTVQYQSSRLSGPDDRLMARKNATSTLRWTSCVRAKKVQSLSRFVRLFFLFLPLGRVVSLTLPLRPTDKSRMFSLYLLHRILWKADSTSAAGLLELDQLPEFSPFKRMFDTERWTSGSILYYCKLKKTAHGHEKL